MENSPRKIEFSALKERMNVFLNFPQAELEIQESIELLMQRIMLSKAENGHRPPVDVLTDYLANATDASEQKDRIKILVGFAGGSLERLKRIYQAIYKEAWRKLKKEECIRIASFLISPESEKIFIPEFVKRSFCLPDNWIKLLQNENYLKSIIINVKQADYAVKIGMELEKEIHQTVEALGLPCEKGGVEIVDNKEVDVIIPNKENPRILIMSSYQLTTSSSQSSKANEQGRMYQDIQTHNRRRKNMKHSGILFVNVLDGGGWLARSNDLQRMWTECDYCFTYSDMEALRELLLSIQL